MTRRRGRTASGVKGKIVCGSNAAVCLDVGDYAEPQFRALEFLEVLLHLALYLPLREHDTTADTSFGGGCRIFRVLPKRADRRDVLLSDGTENRVRGGTGKIEFVDQ